MYEEEEEEEAVQNNPCSHVSYASHRTTHHKAKNSHGAAGEPVAQHQEQGILEVLCILTLLPKRLRHDALLQHEREWCTCGANEVRVVALGNLLRSRTEE